VLVRRKKVFGSGKRNICCVRRAKQTGNTTSEEACYLTPFWEVWVILYLWRIRVAIYLWEVFGGINVCTQPKGAGIQDTQWLLPCEIKVHPGSDKFGTYYAL
jgi:hypothetical protein